MASKDLNDANEVVRSFGANVSDVIGPVNDLYASINTLKRSAKGMELEGAISPRDVRQFEVEIRDQKRLQQELRTTHKLIAENRQTSYYAKEASLTTMTQSQDPKIQQQAMVDFTNQSAVYEKLDAAFKTVKNEMSAIDKLSKSTQAHWKDVAGSVKKSQGALGEFWTGMKMGAASVSAPFAAITPMSRGGGGMLALGAVASQLVLGKMQEAYQWEKGMLTNTSDLAAEGVNVNKMLDVTGAHWGKSGIATSTETAELMRSYSYTGGLASDKQLASMAKFSKGMGISPETVGNFAGGMAGMLGVKDRESSNSVDMLSAAVAKGVKKSDLGGFIMNLNYTLKGLASEMPRMTQATQASVEAMQIKLYDQNLTMEAIGKLSSEIVSGAMKPQAGTAKTLQMLSTGVLYGAAGESAYMKKIGMTAAQQKQYRADAALLGSSSMTALHQRSSILASYAPVTAAKEMFNKLDQMMGGKQGGTALNAVMPGIADTMKPAAIRYLRGEKVATRDQKATESALLKQGKGQGETEFEKFYSSLNALPLKIDTAYEAIMRNVGEQEVKVVAGLVTTLGGDFSLIHKGANALVAGFKNLATAVDKFIFHISSNGKEAPVKVKEYTQIGGVPLANTKKVNPFDVTALTNPNQPIYGATGEVFSTKNPKIKTISAYAASKRNAVDKHNLEETNVQSVINLENKAVNDNIASVMGFFGNIREKLGKMTGGAEDTPAAAQQKDLMAALLSQGVMGPQGVTITGPVTVIANNPRELIAGITRAAKTEAKKK